MLITDRLREWLEGTGRMNEGDDDAACEKAVSAALADGALKPGELAALSKGVVEAEMVRLAGAGAIDADREQVSGWHRVARGFGLRPTPTGARAGGDTMKTGNTEAPPKGAKGNGRWGAKRAGAKHMLTGKTVQYGGREFEHSSDLDKAKVGVFALALAKKAGVAPRPLRQDEEELMAEMLEAEEWAAGRKDADPEYVTGGPKAVKALLDDTVSGGMFLAPVAFDSSIVTYPLLNGQLYPYVDVIDLPMGRRGYTPTLANPTATWGIAAGTAIQPFNTSNLVGAMSWNVYDITVGIEFSNVLQSDSPVDIGARLEEVVGQRLQEELDKVIALGDGTTQPWGITNSGLGSVLNSDGGVSGNPTVGDCEGLIFSVPKQYRDAGWNPAFVMSDILYRRLRSIPVGPGDQRRVFGMDTQSYQLLEYPVRICNFLSQQTGIFGCLRKYRMFRRGGFQFTVTREGAYLVNRGETLLVVRGRFGGLTLDASAFGMIQDFAA